MDREGRGGGRRSLMRALEGVGDGEGAASRTYCSIGGDSGPLCAENGRFESWAREAGDAMCSATTKAGAEDDSIAAYDGMGVFEKLGVTINEWEGVIVMVEEFDDSTIAHKFIIPAILKKGVIELEE